ncbi:MAG: O-antigen ligase family protein [Undibacterium sp.]|nr:O-antigen ligase family protein [Undibacterium sp.]
MKFKSIPISLALVLFPLLSLAVRGSANILFYVLLLSGVGFLFTQKNQLTEQFKKFLPLNIAMAGLFFAVLVHEVFSGNFDARSFDAPLRLAWFPILLFALTRLTTSQLKVVQWGWIVGALMAALHMFMITRGGTTRETQSFFIPLNAFAEMGLLLGLFSACTLAWTNGKKVVVGLIILATTSVLYTTYLSQARGAWLLLPVLAALAFFATRKLPIKTKIGLAAALLLACCLVFYFGDLAKKRVKESLNEVSLYLDQVDKDTHLGVRFQLWEGSWQLFTEHPLIGIGKGQKDFPAAMNSLRERHIISPLAARYTHSHNEILYHAVTLGIIGILALLALYFVPIIYFFREIHHPDKVIASTAGMGFMLSAGFFVFGLVDVMLIWGVCNTFYVVCLATLMAIIIKRKEELK